MNYRAILAVMLIGFGACWAAGQTLPAEKNDKANVSAGTKKRIAELEKRAEALRVENAALRKRVLSLMLKLGGDADPSDSAKQLAGLSVEISLLDAENQALKNKLEALKKKFAGADNNDAAAGKDTSAQSKSLAAKSILAVLNKMPDELLPRARKGWDKRGHPKAKAWITKALRGKQFEAEVFLQNARVGDYDRDRDKWEVTVAFKFPKTAFTFHGVRVDIRPWNNPPGRYYSSEEKYRTVVPEKAYVSGDTAKRLNKLPKGAKVKWRGNMWRCQVKESRHEGKVGYIISTCIRIQEFAILEQKPAATRPRGTKVATKTSANPAASRLKLAKGYISAEMKHEAQVLLEQIIRSYPNSKEATEAKSLLKIIKVPEPKAPAGKVDK